MVNPLENLESVKAAKEEVKFLAKNDSKHKNSLETWKIH